MTDLHQRRRDFTAGEIEQVAVQLFAEHGFDEVTVDAIAAAAGISARTFFRYFPNKADVLRWHQRRLFDRLERALRARPQPEPALDSLREAFLATAVTRAEDRAGMIRVGKVLNSQAVGGHSFAFVGEHVNQLVDVLVERGAQRDLALEARVSAVVAAAQTAFRWWVDADDGAPLTEVMGEAFAAVLPLGNAARGSL